MAAPRTLTDALIGQLLPEIQVMCRALLVAAEAAGIRLCVTQGYRSSVQQAALYAKGRTAPGLRVTNAPPGSSWHEFRRAFDVAILDSVGKPTWPNDPKIWARIGALGKACGLEWGGDWTSIHDLPHFQHTGGMTLAQARAIGCPPAPPRA